MSYTASKSNRRANRVLEEDQWASHEDELVQLVNSLINWKMVGCQKLDAKKDEYKPREVVIVSGWGGIASGEESDIAREVHSFVCNHRSKQSKRYWTPTAFQYCSSRTAISWARPIE